MRNLDVIITFSSDLFVCLCVCVTKMNSVMRNAESSEEGTRVSLRFKFSYKEKQRKDYSGGNNTERRQMVMHSM